MQPFAGSIPYCIKSPPIAAEIAGTNFLAAARAEGRIGGRHKKLDAAKRAEIAESVLSGRKTGADMARLYEVSQPTVSRIVAEYRQLHDTPRAYSAHGRNVPI